MAQEGELVLLEKRGHVAIITLNRTKAGNAINGEISQKMKEVLDQIEADDEIWVSVLRSAHPKMFSVGADLKAMGSGKLSISNTNGGFAGIVTHNRTKPIIAAVNGIAFGGGFEIVLSCDLVVASKSSQFGLPEVKVGLFAAAGGAFRLSRKLPMSLAMEMQLTGEPVSADFLFQHGLLNRVVDGGAAEVEAVALELAEKIAANSPLAVRQSRRVAMHQWISNDEQGFRETTDAMNFLVRTPDFFEGIRSFGQKRKPKWTGKSKL
eukprot:c8568_g1_i2.p1 GENE.c8568_g1_i2~~c8568_g1_i2.p1  ORF type:complete len:265 (+),score=63.53 c8568_g1_i2:42-836(+)